METSLIEEFKYPKLGPGQLWDVTGEEIGKLGGTILKNAKVVGFRNDGDDIAALNYEKDGERHTLEGDYFISSMPVKDLVAWSILSMKEMRFGTCPRRNLPILEPKKCCRWA